jgi:hypothetical protein
VGLIVKIDKKLNLVTNITREDGSIVYLHVTPFPYEVVEEHCLLLGNLFTNFISQVGGLGAARVAAMMLRKKLKREQELRDEANQQAPTIVDEIQRLTSVVWNDGGTWKTTSFEAAMKQGIISPDEYREVEGEVVFYGFLCHSESSTDRPDGGLSDRHVRWATRIIERYGVPRFVADVESAYRYPDPECPAGNVIYTLLDWASNEGFWRVIRKSPAKSSPARRSTASVTSFPR